MCARWCVCITFLSANRSSHWTAEGGVNRNLQTSPLGVLFGTATHTYRHTHTHTLNRLERFRLDPGVWAPQVLWVHVLGGPSQLFSKIKSGLFPLRYTADWLWHMPTFLIIPQICSFTFQYENANLFLCGAHIFMHISVQHSDRRASVFIRLECVLLSKNQTSRCNCHCVCECACMHVCWTLQPVLTQLTDDCSDFQGSAD